MNKAQEIINQWIEFKNPEIHLDLSNLNLNVLPNFPNNVKHLNCNNNTLKAINLPENLISLQCDNNNLTELLLPFNLTHLHCSDNNLKRLILPPTLIVLKCNDNDITSLNLPHNLKFLDCAENNLKELILPQELRFLKCGNNSITSLTLNIKIKKIFTDVFTKINNYEYLINNNSVNYNDFNKFYELNISKCFFDPTYPINKINVDLWLEELKKYENNDLLNWGYSISRTLRHVSFKEFYDSVCRLGYKLDEFIYLNLLENNNLIFYFYIPQIYKSNLWVLLLIWKFINVDVDVNVNIKIISDLHLISKLTDCKIIYIDDCSYTGNQIVENINVSTTEKVNIFIPYISKPALQKFQGYGFNIYYIDLISNFTKMISRNEIRSYNNVLDTYPEYENNEEISNSNICNIYFDHKLPDFISVFQTLYAYGQLPKTNNSYTNGVGSFISGCEEFYKNYVIDQKVIDLQDSFNIICPIAFYKTIQYESIDILTNLL